MHVEEELAARGLDEQTRRSSADVPGHANVSLRRDDRLIELDDGTLGSTRTDLDRLHVPDPTGGEGEAQPVPVD